VLAEQRLLPRQRSPATAFNARQSTQKSSTREKAHRTVYRTCRVHHRTVRWSRRLQLQRSESNGSVTWQAHRTVSGGAPDCPVCHATAAFHYRNSLNSRRPETDGNKSKPTGITNSRRFRAYSRRLSAARRPLSGISLSPSAADENN
jgi:hypothetical protein